MTMARTLAQALTLEWIGTYGQPAKPGKLKIIVNFYPPNKRRYDVDNLVGRCKAYQDGIFQALGWDDKDIVTATYNRGDAYPPDGWVDFMICEVRE